MSTTYFITGTSKGIGKALAGFLLESSSDHVYGYARSLASFNSRAYHHTEIDLSLPSSLADFKFPDTGSDKVVLINNAGLIKPIKRVGQQDFQELASQMNVNILAPIQLCNQFVKQFGNKKELLVLNMSSGAASNAVDGWSSYCASKAAIDIYSETLQLEFLKDDIKGKVFSISPGVVDTPMQVEIRSSEESQFNRLEHFKNLKNNSELANPEEIAMKISWILNHYQDLNQTSILLRDVKV